MLTPSYIKCLAGLAWRLQVSFDSMSHEVRGNGRSAEGMNCSYPSVRRTILGTRAALLDEAEPQKDAK